MYDTFLAKLASSCLDETDAVSLGITFHQAGEPTPMWMPPVANMRIPYFDFNGNHLHSWPNSPQFERRRLLQNFISKGTKKPLRYVQIKDVPPAVYYPSNYDWKTVQTKRESDPDDFKPRHRKIIITEGELKAACACKYGFPTIGLGGVESFRAMSFNVDWVESLDFISWLGQHVVIMYDSDCTTNDDVMRARTQLVNKLIQKGAVVYIGSIPPELNKKVGIDDYILANGIESFSELVLTAKPTAVNDKLVRMNDEYCYVDVLSQVVRLKDSVIQDGWASKVKFIDGSNASVRMQTLTGKFKDLKLREVWWDWEQRNTKRMMVYKPGKDRYVDGDINIWPGYKCKPVEGDVSQFLTLINHLLDDNEDDVHWLLSWLSYPLQNPGAKLNTAVIMFGAKQGTGKSLVGVSMEYIYGDNFQAIMQRDLTSTFNDWAMGKQFVMGDDITAHKNAGEADVVKKMITQSEIAVNQKYLKTFKVTDTVNFFFTTNRPNAFTLEVEDRRYFVAEVKRGPLNTDFYMDYDFWLKYEGGASNIFYYLLNYDVSDFNPSGAARMNQAKIDMINSCKSGLAEWVTMLAEQPDNILIFGKAKIDRDIFTGRELLYIYDPDGKNNTTLGMFGNQLYYSGIKKVNNGAKIQMSGNRDEYYYAVRNNNKWMKATTQELKDHIRGNKFLNL